MLELDELWSFVGSKANPRWVWIALCRQTRQIVAYFVGDRSAESARALGERIPPDYRCRATRSDFWLPYAEVFPKRTHRLYDKGEGETCYVERWNCTLRQRLGPLRAQNALLFQVRPHARTRLAFVRSSLQSVL